MKTSVWAVLAVAAFTCHWAQGQGLYRCGNQYQQFPCASGQPGKPVNASGAGKSAAASTATDAECAARGMASQKIMWAREAGATQDKQLAELRANGQHDGAQTKLIAAVYARRGTVPEVRAAIEAECAAEKDKAAQAAALRAAAAKLDGQGATAPAAGTAAPASRPADGSASPIQASAAGTAATGASKSQCESYVRQLDSIRNSQRNSGSVAQMESLNNQRRAIEANQKAAGC